jgi:hypothetical protein
MQAQANYPIVTAVIDLIVAWWRRERRQYSGLESLPAADVARIAKDIGVSTADLRALDRAADKPLGLPRMMAALQLDPATVARREPETFRDMQRVCAFCESKKRCERDLADGDAAIHLDAYCPNAQTLRELC